MESNSDPSPATLWNVRDVATYLKVSCSWVYHAAESGKLPCFRIGNLLRFDPEELKAYARGTRRSGAEILSFRSPRAKR